MTRLPRGGEGQWGTSSPAEAPGPVLPATLLRGLNEDIAVKGSVTQPKVQGWSSFLRIRNI